MSSVSPLEFMRLTMSVDSLLSSDQPPQLPEGWQTRARQPEEEAVESAAEFDDSSEVSLNEIPQVPRIAVLHPEEREKIFYPVGYLVSEEPEIPLAELCQKLAYKTCTVQIRTIVMNMIELGLLDMNGPDQCLTVTHKFAEVKAHLRTLSKEPFAGKRAKVHLRCKADFDDFTQKFLSQIQSANRYVRARELQKMNPPLQKTQVTYLIKELEKCGAISVYTLQSGHVLGLNRNYQPPQKPVAPRMLPPEADQLNSAPKKILQMLHREPGLRPVDIQTRTKFPVFQVFGVLKFLAKKGYIKKEKAGRAALWYPKGTVFPPPATQSTPAAFNFAEQKDKILALVREKPLIRTSSLHYLLRAEISFKKFTNGLNSLPELTSHPDIDEERWRLSNTRLADVVERLDETDWAPQHLQILRDLKNTPGLFWSQLRQGSNVEFFKACLQKLVNLKIVTRVERQAGPLYYLNDA